MPPPPPDSLYARTLRLALECEREDLVLTITIGEVLLLSEFTRIEDIGRTKPRRATTVTCQITGTVLWRAERRIDVHIPVAAVGAQWRHLSSEFYRGSFRGVGPDVHFPFPTSEDDSAWRVFLDSVEDIGVRAWLERNGVIAEHGTFEREVDADAFLSVDMTEGAW